MFWYIFLVWLLPPIIIVSLLSTEGGKGLGVILLVIWGIFIIPRILEGVCLFVVLPFLVLVGMLKGIAGLFK